MEKDERLRKKHDLFLQVMFYSYKKRERVRSVSCTNLHCSMRAKNNINGLEVRSTKIARKAIGKKKEKCFFFLWIVEKTRLIKYFISTIVLCERNLNCTKE